MNLSQEIIDRFTKSMHEARLAGEQEPTAMVLGTSDGQGLVTTRTVLLKALDADGFVFFTNTRSRKGRQMAQCPRVAATFLWKTIYCQVHLVGSVTPVTDQEADAYFATRDRGSQVGAWASDQSRPLDSRDTLLGKVREFEQKFAGLEVPRPPHWSGYRIRPDTVEFWHGHEFRLHDRFFYTQSGQGWQVHRLYP